MKLHVLICCFNDSLLDVPDILLPERPDVSYVISHQHSAGYSLPDDTDELKSRLNEMLARPDVVLTSIEGKGVSRNRNNCLMKCFETAADDDVCLIADDDVRYFKDSFDRVLSAFSSNPSAGFIQFRIKTLGSSRQFRRLPYPVNPYRIRKVAVRGSKYVSSIEMAFRCGSVRSSGIRFNEQFGLGGTVYPEGGEESIFLCDCLRSGIKAYYVPVEIVEHPYESSSKAPKTIAKARMYLAVAEYVYGSCSYEALIARLRIVYRKLKRLPVLLNTCSSSMQ